MHAGGWGFIVACAGRCPSCWATAGIAAADDDVPVPLPVGTTVDLSVSSVGPIRDVAVADQTYVAIEDNGLWVLQSDGKTIEKVSAPSDAIAAMAADGAQYYIGTDKGLYSGHAGDWQARVGDIISAICVQADPPVYLAGAHHGLWRSDDGEQWAAVSLADVLVSGCAIAGTTAYAATSGGVYRSTDAGHTWALAHDGIATRYVGAVAVAGNTVYAATGGAGLYASTDGAATWTQIAGPPLGLEDVKATGGVLSVWGDGTLLQSSDGGTSWTTRMVPGADNLNAVQLLNGLPASQ